MEPKPLSNAPYENRIHRQKENVPKRDPLHLQPARKRLMAREEGNRASCLEERLKPPLFLEFISNGVTNIHNNHVPLEHYIGQFTAGEMVLFHHDIVPICANARDDDPRRSISRQEISVCVPERNTAGTSF